jgi:hypothetical protein
VKLLVVLLFRHLVLLSRQLVVESPVITLPSRPLITTPSRLLASPLIILSMHHPLIVSLQRLVVIALPLIAPPSRPLVTLHSRPLVVLSLRNPLAVSFWGVGDPTALIYGFLMGTKNISRHERILQGLHRNW